MQEDYALWEEKMARSKAQLDLLQVGMAHVDIQSCQVQILIITK